MKLKTGKLIGTNNTTWIQSHLKADTLSGLSTFKVVDFLRIRPILLYPLTITISFLLTHFLVLFSKHGIISELHHFKPRLNQACSMPLIIMFIACILIMTNTIGIWQPYHLETLKDSDMSPISMLLFLLSSLITPYFQLDAWLREVIWICCTFQGLYLDLKLLGKHRRILLFRQEYISMLLELLEKILVTQSNTILQEGLKDLRIQWKV